MTEALQRCNGSFIKLNQTDNSTVDLVNQFRYSQVWTDLKKKTSGWKWLDGTMANVTCKYKMMLPYFTGVCIRDFGKGWSNPPEV